MTVIIVDGSHLLWKAGYSRSRFWSIPGWDRVSTGCLLVFQYTLRRHLILLNLLEWPNGRNTWGIQSSTGMYRPEYSLISGKPDLSSKDELETLSRSSTSFVWRLCHRATSSAGPGLSTHPPHILNISASTIGVCTWKSVPSTSYKCCQGPTNVSPAVPKFDARHKKMEAMKSSPACRTVKHLPLCPARTDSD